MKDKVIIVQMLIDKAEEYAKTSFELYKLKAIDKGTDIFASVFSHVIIFVVVTLFLLLGTIGLCLYLGELLGKTYYGFFAVAGFYLLIAIICIAFRKVLMEDTLNDFMVKQIFKKKDR